MKGFVDLQVNGFVGVDFSAPGLKLEQVKDVINALLKRGTVAFCPTIITSPMEVYEENLPVLARAMGDEALSPHLLGIHLEGPFISPEDGARGAHPRRDVLPPSLSLYQKMADWADNRISLITVSPEHHDSEELIRYITSTDVVVALGHHLGRHSDIARACASGAKVVTHLGNGIPAVLPRHPNQLWDQLDEDRLFVTIIADGYHVPESFVRVVVKVKTTRRVIVVSDAVPVAGLPPGRYTTMGQDIILSEAGPAWNIKEKHLVGSGACMIDCMNWFSSVTSLPEEELWRVGYHNPLNLMSRRLDSARFGALPNIKFADGKFHLTES
jgi:N-acetylglucosamine-6-phosphate deacetylase